MQIFRVPFLVVVGITLVFADCGGKTNPTNGSTGGGDGAAGAFNLPVECSLAAESGNCDAYFPAYWHDPATGVCRPFVYGGCGGNANRYSTLAECQSTCHGVAAEATELDRCVTHADCELAPESCCGGCDPAFAWDFVVVTASSRELWRTASGCIGVMCEPCLTVAPVDRTTRYLQAQCLNGQCTQRDVRDSALTECNVPSDCRLRCGTGCCPACDASKVIALRADTNDTEAFCGTEAIACDACACEPTSTVAADCVNHRCVVTGESVCTVGADQTCNDDLSMSSLAGTCNVDGTCTCATGRTQNALTGRCL